MKICLVILLLTNLTFGEKLNNEYLPPPGAYKSGGDLNYNDLPFELPNDSQDSKIKPQPEIQTIGNDGFQGLSTVMPNTFNTPARIYDSTTNIIPVAEYNPTVYSELINTDYAIEPKVMNSDYFTLADDISLTTDRLELLNKVAVTDKLYYFPNSTPNIMHGDDKEKHIPNDKRISQPQRTSPLQSLRRVQVPYDRSAIITRQENTLTPDGFAYNFNTSNGMQISVYGNALNGVKSIGEYSYIGDDGKMYRMEYTADENGFQPRGNHLPTPPPIPEAIQKVIEQAYKDKSAGISDDGSYSDEKYGYKKYMPKIENRLEHTKVYKTKNGEDTVRNYDRIKNTQFDRVYPTQHKKNNLIITGINNKPNDFMNNDNILKEDQQFKRPLDMPYGIIPVQVIYDQGYSYSLPQNKFTLDNMFQTGPKEIQSSVNQVNPQKPLINVGDNVLFSTTTEGMISRSNVNDDIESTTIIPTTKYSTILNSNMCIDCHTDSYSATIKPKFVDSNMLQSTSLNTPSTDFSSEVPYFSEEFKGPNQRPKYDPQFGYYYK